MSDSVTTELLEFIRRLATTAATASLYDMEHPQVVHLSKQTKEHLDKLFCLQDEFTLMLIDGRLVFEQKPVENEFSVSKLCRFLHHQGIAHISLKKGLTDDELQRLIELLSKKSGAPGKIAASRHLRIGQIEIQSSEEELPEAVKEKFLSLKEIESADTERFQEIFEAAQKGRNLHVRGLGEIVDSFIHAFSEQGSSLFALAPLRDLDEYTYTHSTNVCVLNIAQAKMLGIEGQLLYEIGISAMLHDIGKLFVPVEILQKEGALDEQEWAIIQQHPQLGAEYLVNTPGIPRLAIITAYEHHMRYDNSGYPKVNKRWPQHICSQLTTISDFFDALRTHRSYRAGMDFDKIAGIMLEEAGTTLHPQLTRNFLTHLHKLDHSALA